MTASKKSDRYVPALTGLRAVAAYLVFLHHYNPAAPGTLSWQVFHQGYIGVAIFFVLSGFLLYHRYADAYLGQRNWSWQRYLRNRFARIYPLYAFLFLITAGIAAWLGHPMDLVAVGLNLMLLKGFFDPEKFSGIAQSWSLTVEACFYLLAPFLFLALRHWGAFWLTGILFGTSLLLWLTVGQLTWHGLLGTLPFVLFYTFFGRGFEFVVGMWLARRWHQGRLSTISYPSGIGLFIGVVCVGWQSGLPLYTASAIVLVWSEVVVYNFCFPIGIGFFFLGLISRPSGIGRLFSHPVMQTLGRSSYAFYLIHVGVIASGLQKTGITNRWLLFGLLVVVAHVVYRFLEKPLQRLLRAD